MRKIFEFVLLMGAVAFTISAQSVAFSKVPAAVNTAFTKKHHGVKVNVRRQNKNINQASALLAERSQRSIL